ncbi:MAG: epoxyqueuosine reductase QueH [bacterium]
MALPKLLLHACCAPCAPHVYELLSGEYEVLLYFYNPNIFPEDEYNRRLEELKRFCGEKDIPLIEGNYDKDKWAEAIKGFEEEPEGGKRCAKCFSLRLAETARRAAGAGCSRFTTTLTVSPRKNAEVINRIGREAGERAGVEFLEENFKKKDGYKISCDLSHERGFYRQDYCGCEYSMRKK